MVHPILEGLRSENFMVARDVELDRLTQEDGKKALMDATKKVVRRHENSVGHNDAGGRPCVSSTAASN